MRPPAEHAALTTLVTSLVGAPRTQRLLESFPSAHALGRAGPAELQEAGGLTAAQAARIVAASEMGRRALRPPWDDAEPLCEPEAVWRFYRGEMGGLAHERLVAVALDAKCRRVGEARVSEGQQTRCLVEPPQVFRPMLRFGAVSALLVHNHPSGDPTPSAADRAFTLRIAQAGRNIGIAVVDHVIVTRRGHHSMAVEGVLT
jgi:DNA repair protein RadC